MVFLLLGGLTLLVLLAALGMFSGAQVRTIKAFGIWTVALGGLVLAALLFFTGRGAAALGDLLMLGILIWPWIQQHQRLRRGGGPGAGGSAGGSGGGPGRGQGQRGGGPRAGRSGMTRDEALAVLGLQPSANEDDIRAAHKRLMRVAHPDNGGSDWLASRLNQARDTLLA